MYESNDPSCMNTKKLASMVDEEAKKETKSGNNMTEGQMFACRFTIIIIIINNNNIDMVEVQP
ncbi:hypothetical protein DERF_004651 [Dermatophagoides farinae]|uniref:Uncharacterized protein n=1 Tax=Dermatophagoides farinae TaxID=6954 RepID=A0A922L5F2_DERFA|nr:hypothetical protein DERF_004651 [Dermatophagoides farinae]